MERERERGEHREKRRERTTGDREGKGKGRPAGPFVRVLWTERGKSFFSPRKRLSTYVGMKTLLSAVPLCRLFPAWTRRGLRGFSRPGVAVPRTAAATSNSLVERFPASRMEFAPLSSTSVKPIARRRVLDPSEPKHRRANGRFQNADRSTNDGLAKKTNFCGVRTIGDKRCCSTASRRNNRK